MTALSPPQPRNRRDLWLTGGLLAFMALGLVGLATATGWEETFASLERLGWTQIGILLALSVANYVLRAFRWQLYCAVLGIKVTLTQTFRHYIGGFAMTVTPGRVGEFVRLRWIQRETGTPMERTAAVVVADRAADLAAMGLITAVAVSMSATGLAGGVPVAILSVILAIVITRATLLIFAVDTLWHFVRRWPRLFARGRRLGRALAPFSAWPVVLPALAFGFVGWFAEAYAFYLLLGWMGAELPLWTAVGIFVISMITGGMTGAPGGVGGAEAVMVALLSLQGIPISVSVPATAVIRLTTLWFAILLGVIVFPFATRYALRGTHATQS